MTGSRQEINLADMQVLVRREVAAFAEAPSSTGWVFDIVAGRYRNLHTGAFISGRDMVQLRNDFVASRGSAVERLAQLLISQGLSLGEWQAAMEAEIKVAIGVEYAFGAGGILVMDDNDWTAVEQLAELHTRYLERFTQAIKDGQVSEAQLRARSLMYIDAGVQAFERGQASANDVELPEYPGENCDGLVNCRCYWQLDEQDDGTVEAKWVAVGDGSTCQPCEDNAHQYNPLVLEPVGGSASFGSESPRLSIPDDPACYALANLERGTGNAEFGWVTINGEHILISDVKTGSYSVGITSDQFQGAKIGDKAKSFELQRSLAALRASNIELTIGRGGWKDETGKLFEENALSLSFRDGSPTAVAREMATLGGHWDQQSALVQHYVRAGGEPQAHIDLGRRLSDAEVTDVAGGLKDHFGGWTFAVDPKSGSTTLVVSNVKAWGGPPDGEFKAQVHAVADALNQGGLDTSVGWRRVENIPLDHLNDPNRQDQPAKLSADGYAWRRDQGSSTEAEGSELQAARAEEAEPLRAGSGDVPRDVPEGLEAGILARLTEAEQLRQTLEDSVRFGWVTIDGQHILIGSPAETAAAHATIAALKDPSTGHVVGAPANAQTAQGLLELRAHVASLAAAGASQKNWYSDSSKAILEAAQGDKVDAEKLAQLVAIYSPQASPSVDMNNALDAWYQWKAGVPIQVGMGARDQVASNFLYHGQEWSGLKTNNFYRNLMVGIDSTVANKMGSEVGQSGVTVDIWMMRAFNYQATPGTKTDDGQPREFLKAPSPQQYKFIQSEVDLVAKKQGWTPEQAQAAIWSATKAKSEGTSTDAAGYTFADALAERTGIVSGKTSTAFRDAQDRDALAVSLGLLGGDNTFALPKAPQSSAGRDIKGNVGRVQEDARAAITAYTAGRALLLKQPSATWTRIFTSPTLKASNATVIDAGRPLTASETSAFNLALNTALGRADAHAFVPTESGAWVLSTTQPPTGKRAPANFVANTAFQKAVTQALHKVTTVDTVHVPARYDGESLTNNWRTHPNGETYLTTIQRSGQADNFGAVAGSLATRLASASGSPASTGFSSPDTIDGIVARLEAAAEFGWVTINGQHVLIGDDGAILQGGSHLDGQAGGSPPLARGGPAAPAPRTRTRNDIYEPQREGGYVQGQTWIANPDGSYGEVDEIRAVTKPPATLSADFKAPYEFSSTQVNLPDELVALVRDFQETIDPEDLATGGFEDQPHITVKYGLHASVAAQDVALVVGRQPAVNAIFGRVAAFPEGKSGVPLIVAVYSPGLERLHAALLALPNTETFSYTPHATIAYVKPEAASRYVGSDGPLFGLAATFNEIAFSSTDGTQTAIQLGSAKFGWVTIDDGRHVFISDPAGGAAVASVPRSTGSPQADGSLHNPIYVDGNLDQAVRAIGAGQHVRMDQPSQVSTLIDRLGAIAQDAASKGEKAPSYDLGMVTVPGTNLFTQNSIGISRVNMPQLQGATVPGTPAATTYGLKANLYPSFRAELVRRGYQVTDETVPAANLRATQLDLNGATVAGVMHAEAAGTLKEQRIFVTKDDYILDGHHRWAAKVGADLRDNTLGDVTMPVARVNTDIGTMLDLTSAYASAMGVKQGNSIAAARTTFAGDGEHWVTIDGNPVLIGHSPAVMAVTSALRESAVARAAQVTPLLQQIAAEQGSKLVGLQFAIKGEESLARKIESRVKLLGIDPAKVPISDALRYTMVSDANTLAASTASAIEKLQLNGFKVQADNFWVRGDTYNGINADVFDPKGQRFEFQIHTPDSLALKESTHADYEIMRDLSKPVSVRSAAFQRMVQVADAMPLPPDIMKVGKPALKPFRP